LFREPEPEPEPEPEEEDIIPEIGETIVFRMEPTEVHQDGFGIGKVLAINDSNVHFQWYASKFYLITSPFALAWTDAKSNFQYYSPRKIHKEDVPHLGTATSTTVTVKDLIVKGYDLLDDNRRLIRRARAAIRAQQKKK